MVVGILQFELHIPASTSLKDKRRVVRAIKDRLHRDHMVSVAETDHLDTINLAVLGLACAGSDGKAVARTLDHISERLRAWPDTELGRTTRELLTGDMHAYAHAENPT
ncbi:MAG: DUF503 domain-containing protein [Planctomycetes bacterium]|nr:DUF503 domain-containing protein [Planctomycetota bacterium]